MGVKVFDRELLHMFEKLIAHPLHASLCDKCHRHGLRQLCHNTDAVKNGYPCHCSEKRAVIDRPACFRRLLQRRDVVIDQGSCEHSALYVRKDRCNNAHQHENHVRCIVLHDEFHQPAENLARVLHFLTRTVRPMPAARTRLTYHSCSLFCHI